MLPVFREAQIKTEDGRMLKLSGSGKYMTFVFVWIPEKEGPLES